MSEDKTNKIYPDAAAFHRQKENDRKNQSRRPVAEKMAAVVRLRDFERKLENIRKANRAKRAAKQIKIEIKTR